MYRPQSRLCPYVQETAYIVNAAFSVNRARKGTARKLFGDDDSGDVAVLVETPDDDGHANEPVSGLESLENDPSSGEKYHYKVEKSVLLIRNCVSVFEYHFYVG